MSTKKITRVTKYQPSGDGGIYHRLQCHTISIIKMYARRLKNGHLSLVLNAVNKSCSFFFVNFLIHTVVPSETLMTAKRKQYQPRGAWCTHSPPAMQYRLQCCRCLKSKMAAMRFIKRHGGLISCC